LQIKRIDKFSLSQSLSLSLCFSLYVCHAMHDLWVSPLQM
jgi:hypothetical protein